MKKKDIWISIGIIAAAALTFRLYCLGKGLVEIDAGGATAELEIRGSLFNKTTMSTGTGPWRVRGRVHRPQRLSLSMQQEGQNWRIDSHGPWGHLSRIKLKNNQTKTLRLGPPFLIRPNISKSGSRIAIDYAIVGQAGEQYQNLATKNGRPVIGAELTIVDETGNVLDSGKFKYG